MKCCPDYWGLLNPDWKLCNRGRRQSPIDIEPSILLYDPGMGNIEINREKVNGTLKNTGHSVRFRLDPDSPPVTVNGGPLSYKYRVHEVLLHYGRTDDRGSEHTIAGHAFPGELQILAYNNQLYDSMAEAMPKTQGIVAVTVMFQLANISSPDLRLLTSQLDKIIHKGQTKNISHISLHGILPETRQFMTYEGSTTMPGCHETVTWILLNRPIYITKSEMYLLSCKGTKRILKPFSVNNFRPPQPLTIAPSEQMYIILRQEKRVAATETLLLSVNFEGIAEIVAIQLFHHIMPLRVVLCSKKQSTLRTLELHHQIEYRCKDYKNYAPSASLTQTNDSEKYIELNVI
ncbi:putative carbonic anhydrase-like protein 2 [Nephila pilipes]|uniref:Putative carbonic anhydrase-like protein 2 n=1 Tax=Nephila pilipes TaxID=299642 RepID=A0A8X6MYU8_NEPPI|nr:putative carbonic anhydrase-like protein 2 [Nephila pilipes]